MTAGIKKGEILRGPPCEQVGVLALDDLESADAGADEDTDALGVLRGDLEPRLGHRFLDGGEGKVDEAPHLAGLFFVDKVQGVKVLDLGGEGDWKAGGIEAMNGPHATDAGQKTASRLRERCCRHRTPAQGR